MSLVEILLILILLAILWTAYVIHFYLKNIDQNIVYYNTEQHVPMNTLRDEHHTKGIVSLLQEISNNTYKSSNK